MHKKASTFWTSSIAPATAASSSSSLIEISVAFCIEVILTIMLDSVHASTSKLLPRSLILSFFLKSNFLNSSSSLNSSVSSILFLSFSSSRPSSSLPLFFSIDTYSALLRVSTRFEGCAELGRFSLLPCHRLMGFPGPDIPHLLFLLCWFSGRARARQIRSSWINITALGEPG